MKTILKVLFTSIFGSFLITACSSKEEVKTLDYKIQQKNSKEALKEL